MASEERALAVVRHVLLGGGVHLAGLLVMLLALPPRADASSTELGLDVLLILTMLPPPLAVLRVVYFEGASESEEEDSGVGKSLREEGTAAVGAFVVLWLAQMTAAAATPTVVGAAVVVGGALLTVAMAFALKAEYDRDEDMLVGGRGFVGGVLGALLLVHVVLAPLQLVGLAASVDHRPGSQGWDWLLVLELTAGFAYLMGLVRLSAAPPDGEGTQRAARGAFVQALVVFALDVALVAVGAGRLLTVDSYPNAGLKLAAVATYSTVAVILVLSTVVMLAWAVAQFGLSQLCTFFDDAGFEARLDHAPLSVSSRPSVALLLPFVMHFALLAIPQLAVFGRRRFDGLDAPTSLQSQDVLLLDLGISVSALSLMAVASVCEALLHTFRRTLRLVFVASTAFVVTACLLRLRLSLGLGEDDFSGGNEKEALFQTLFAGQILFWILMTFWVLWLAFVMGSGAIEGVLWEACLPGISSTYYTHEDAKSAGEAAVATVAAGCALTVLVLPLDLGATVLCGRSHKCDDEAYRVTAASFLASAVFLAFTVVLLLLTRLRMPPALVVPFGCLRNQIFWVLNFQQNSSTAASFVLCVLLFDLGCSHHASSAGGQVKTLMIFSACFRLVAFPLTIVLDISTRSDRTSGFTNALGTGYQMFQLLAEEVASHAAHGPGVLGTGSDIDIVVDGGSAGYGTTGQGVSLVALAEPMPGAGWARTLGVSGEVLWTSASERQQQGKSTAAADENTGGHGGAAQAGATDEAAAATGLRFVTRVRAGVAVEWCEASALSDIDGAAIDQLTSLCGVKGGELASVAALPFDKKLLWWRQSVERLHQPWELGHQTVICHRSQLLDEAADQFLKISPEDFRQIFRFDFADEPGIDAGGVAREFFTLVAEQLFEGDGSAGASLDAGAGATSAAAAEAAPPEGGTPPRRPLLFARAANADSVSYQIRPHPEPHNLPQRVRDLYRFAGRLLAKAIFDGHTVEAHLARPLYACLLGLGAGFDDLQYLDDALLRQLQWLRDVDTQAAPTVVEDVCLDFTVTYDMTPWAEDGQRGGSTAMRTVDLVDGGAAQPVTNANREEYVDARWRRRVLHDVAPMLGDFLSGFFDVVPPALLMPFTVDDLEKLMCGEPMIDVADWRAHTNYLGVFKPQGVGVSAIFSSSQPARVVGWFWEVVSELDQRQRQRLLRFVTGSSGVPCGGFKMLAGNDGKTCPFTLQPVEPDSKSSPDVVLLPRAHTCFNRLDLPLYLSKQQLQEVLTSVIATDMAITGFDMD